MHQCRLPSLGFYYSCTVAAAAGVQVPSLSVQPVLPSGLSRAGVRWPLSLLPTVRAAGR